MVRRNEESQENLDTIHAGQTLVNNKPLLAQTARCTWTLFCRIKGISSSKNKML